MEDFPELSARVPEPPLTLPPAVAGPVQGELQLHVGQLALEGPAGSADPQEYQVLLCTPVPKIVWILHALIRLSTCRQSFLDSEGGHACWAGAGAVVGRCRAGDAAVPVAGREPRRRALRAALLPQVSGCWDGLLPCRCVHAALACAQECSLRGAADAL